MDIAGSSSASSRSSVASRSVGLAIVLGIRHERRKRELEHIERMKALEFGRTLPAGRAAGCRPAKIARRRSAVVRPARGLRHRRHRDQRSVGYHEEIWIAGDHGRDGLR